MLNYETFSFLLLAILLKFCRNYTCILISLFISGLWPHPSPHEKNTLVNIFTFGHQLWSIRTYNYCMSDYMYIHIIDKWIFSIWQYKRNKWFHGQSFYQTFLYFINCDIWWWFWLSDLDISLLWSILVIIYIHPDYRL